MSALLFALASEASAAPPPAAKPDPAASEASAAPDPTAPDTQTLRVEVLPEPLNWAPTLSVRVHDAADAPRAFALEPDPSRSGLFTLEEELPARRWRDVELVLDGDTTLWRRVVPAARPDALTVSFLVEQEGEDGPRATRVAWLPLIGTGPRARTDMALAVAFGWGTLVFGYVAWLARRIEA